MPISRSPLSHLGLTSPVFAAPMAGGPSTPDLVVAAARANSLGFLAAGYKSGQLLADQIAAVGAQTQTFGVNLFAPNPQPIDGRAFREYAAALQPVADDYGIDLRTAQLIEDDDAWTDKIDLLLARPVPVVSFTFGLPDESTIGAMRRAGSVTIQTVTSADEARLAENAGIDVLAVQASAAGGHSGTFTPKRLPAEEPLTALITEIRGATALPIIAAGGIATSADVVAALDAGAVAAMAGTVLLRCDESGATAVHQAALADPRRRPTVVTRAFTGRPARGLANSFTDRFAAIAPPGYPALHYLTSGLRKAAAAAGNPELVHLWAGTGYRSATSEPAGVILDRLAESV